MRKEEYALAEQNESAEAPIGEYITLDIDYNVNPPAYFFEKKTDYSYVNPPSGKHWMEDKLAAFKQAILRGNKEFCFIERLKIQQRVKAELPDVAIDERYVQALEWMCEDLSTPLVEGEVLAGRMVEGPWPHEEMEAPAMPEEGGVPVELAYPFFTKGHATQDWPLMLKKGLLRIAEEIKKNADDLGTEQARRFAANAERCCQAVVKFAKRYAEAARQKSESVDNPQYQQHLIRIADALEHVPGRPARNFFEALQGIWLGQLVFSCILGARDFAFGRMDQYLFPYYQADLEQGVLDRDEVRLLLAHLYIKSNEIVSTSDRAQIPSIASHLYITLGGRNENGDPMENELSSLFLEAAPLVGMAKPEINIRMDSQSPAEFKLAVATAMKTCAQQIQLWNESQILNAWETYFPQIRKEDAYNYSFTACNRIDLPGLMTVFITGNENFHVMPTWLLAALNDGHVVEDSYALHDQGGYEYGGWNVPGSGGGIGAFPKVQPAEGIIPLDQMRSMEDILSNFHLLVEAGVAHAHKNAVEQHRRFEPPETFHFDSVLMHDSMEKCLDITQGGMRYPTDIHLFLGLATVADSLTAINQLVFEEKRYTLTEFIAIVRNNFEGHDKLRREILYQFPRYGNDKEAADRWAVAVSDLILDVVHDIEPYPNYTLIPSIYSLFFSHKLGDKYPATPDGRKQGESISENQSPTHGADVDGVTSCLRSAAKIPNGRTVESGLNLRLVGKLDPERFMALAETFFDLGGQHLGVSLTDRDSLLAAVENPEEHLDLEVRVTGYSAFFTGLGEKTQQDIIDRTDH